MVVISVTAFMHLSSNIIPLCNVFVPERQTLMLFNAFKNLNFLRQPFLLSPKPFDHRISKINTQTDRQHFETRHLIIIKTNTQMLWMCLCSLSATAALQMKCSPGGLSQLSWRHRCFPFPSTQSPMQGAANPPWSPISKWRAVIPAQALARWERNSLVVTLHKNLSRTHVVETFPSVILSLVFSVQYKSNLMTGTMSARVTHNQKHNCITASRWGMNQNNIFLKRLEDGCIY